MTRLIKTLITVFIIFLSSPYVTFVYAITDPTIVPNNKIGMHILFPSELQAAAKMANGNGGDWGYVTIPIQAGDKDIKKWQQFMDECRSLHIIPIIRLSTEDDYFNTAVWRAPTNLDIIDSANFLNSLQWPTKNKYVIIFNEPNRADEWGGKVDPAGYAAILSYAVTVFKSKNPDFFILSAGFDNASINTSTAMDEFDYMRVMNASVPGIFSQIDGLASHSYPNPAFSASPAKQDGESIASFLFEEQIAKQLGNKDLPVFITETGWSNQKLSEDTIASYYITALNTVWNNKMVIAVTPFVLQGGGSPFASLSFLDGTTPTKKYLTLQNLAKVKGAPILDTKSVLGSETEQASDIPEKEFLPENSNQQYVFTVPKSAKIMVKWLLKL